MPPRGPSAPTDPRSDPRHAGRFRRRSRGASQAYLRNPAEQRISRSPPRPPRGAPWTARRGGAGAGDVRRAPPPRGPAGVVVEIPGERTLDPTLTGEPDRRVIRPPPDKAPRRGPRGRYS